MRQNLRARKTTRASFTLIELLVVISIIAALVALSAAATIRFITTQQVKNTEATIKTVDSEFRRQWDAVKQTADKEEPCALAVFLANGDPGIAKVIHFKLKLKLEFPMSYYEVLNPPGGLPPIAEYVRQLNKAGVTSDNPATQDENSACLAMALQRSRGGKEASLDDLLGPGVIGTNQYGLKIIKDSWGQPIVFYRWATANAELDASGPGPTSVPAVQLTDPRRDTQDNEGKLQSDPWWSDTTTSPTYRQQFELACHLVSQNNGTTKYAYYMPPVIASGGPNKKLGIKPQPVNGPDPMQVAIPDDANDNLYNFRLRLGGKGD